jgi:hypothetical protein
MVRLLSFFAFLGNFVEFFVGIDVALSVQMKCPRIFPFVVSARNRYNLALCWYAARLMLSTPKLNQSDLVKKRVSNSHVIEAYLTTTVLMFLFFIKLLHKIYLISKVLHSRFS